MTTDLVLLHYNNYFNRQIKVAGTKKSDYTTLDANFISISGVNFNPADGVSSSHVIGKGEVQVAGKELDGYDYLLVVNADDTTNYPVVSRWFIIDRDRTRDGQYRLSLRRDVIVDNYDAVKSATTFIEKGTISDTTNPLLYNSENMTYNQIKESETLLTDKTGIAWVVGYIPQDAFKDTTIVTKQVITAADADDTIDSISNWDYFNISNLTNSNEEIWAENNITKKLLLKTRMHFPSGGGYPERKTKGTLQVLQGGAVSSTVDTSASSYDTWSGVTANYSTYNPVEPTSLSGAEYIASNMPSDTTLWNDATAVLDNRSIGGSVVIKTHSVIQDVLDLDGTTILDEGTQILYRIKVVNVGAGSEASLDSGELASQTLLARINSDKVGYHNNFTTLGDYDYSNVQVGYSGDGYRLELTQTFLSASIVLDQSRAHVVDAQYDMFCIPYADDYVIQYGPDISYSFTTSKELAIGIAEEIAKDSGSGAIYDTQLLPYCPCKELFNLNTWDMERLHYIAIDDLPIDLVRNTTDSWVQVTGIADQASFTTALNTYKHLYDDDKREVYHYTPNINYYRVDYSQGDVMGAIVWCTSSTRTFDIDESISVSNTAVARKIESECDIYRLCSGNYQGIFEFNAAKSYGVSGFRVDCTFKPFNPYIHVIPKLGGLYGSNFADFNDARGLICGGDFSLAQMNNAWANYELQNKNYQQIFDRQIQHMDVTNSIARQQAAFSLASGAISSTISSAVSGAKGGVGGAIAGGAAGFAAGAVGGILDYSNMLTMQKENKQYAVDMYGYNLGNIQAIPTSLAKNTSLTPNTKIFPFVEKYTCTDVEKTALTNKLTYNGMTIMNIGTINPYVGQGFFKGQIIRFNSLKDDNHMANAIYDEINKGVYL